MYCIDLLTPTQIGFGYTLGEWSESNVPNVGYVARLLNSYYPKLTLPPLANNNERAAAVQSSIWFFTDRYVLLPTNPLFSAVSGIVADVITAGPLVQPPTPTVDMRAAADDLGADRLAGRALHPHQQSACGHRDGVVRGDVLGRRRHGAGGQRRLRALGHAALAPRYRGRPGHHQGFGEHTDPERHRVPVRAREPDEPQSRSRPRR